MTYLRRNVSFHVIDQSRRTERVVVIPVDKYTGWQVATTLKIFATFNSTIFLPNMVKKYFGTSCNCLGVISVILLWTYCVITYDILIRNFNISHVLNVLYIVRKSYLNNDIFGNDSLVIFLFWNVSISEQKLCWK